MSDILDEILGMLGNGSYTDFADTKYAIMQRIHLHRNPNPDKTTCDHDWRLAYRELDEEQQPKKHEHDIPAVFYERCTICLDTRQTPKREPKPEEKEEDLPGQLYLDLPLMTKVAIKAPGWTQGGNDAP